MTMIKMVLKQLLCRLGIHSFWPNYHQPDLKDGRLRLECLYCNKIKDVDAVEFLEKACRERKAYCFVK